MAPRITEASGDIKAGVKAVIAVNVGGGDQTFPGITRKIYVGSVGNLAVTFADGSTAVLTAPALGVWHEMQLQSIQQTGTTAGGVLAGF